MAGSVFLGYLGVKALIGSTGLSEAAQTDTDSVYTGNGLRSGFLTAFLNPKLAIFFTALFSQFVICSGSAAREGNYGLDGWLYLMLPGIFLLFLFCSHFKVIGVLSEQSFSA